MSKARLTKVWLTLEQFKALDEYSCSIPTGTTIGKKWKRRHPYGHATPNTVWYQGEFRESSESGMVDIRWSIIERVDGANPAELER
jgi:hypothetical protein